MLPERQSAYQPNYSTETALLGLFNDLLLAANEGDATAILFLDLSAAFDTIDHDIQKKCLRQSAVQIWTIASCLLMMMGSLILELCGIFPKCLITLPSKMHFSVDNCRLIDRKSVV